MKKEYIGNSGLEASVVGLGTVGISGWAYGNVEVKNTVKAIHAALDAGINLIDTAPLYGFGESETIVGRALKGRRSKVVLATKTGLVWDEKNGEFFIYSDDQSRTDSPSKYEVYKNLKPEVIRKEIERSLKRLNTDYIDLYQTHWQDGTTQIDDTMEALLKLKDQGKIRAVGVSNVNKNQLKEYGDIASVQEKYSMVDSTNEDNGIIGYCIDHNIAFLSYFTLEQGLLSGKMTPEKIFKAGDSRIEEPGFSIDNRKRIQKLFQNLEPITEKYRLTPAQLIIALTVAQNGITHALVGARTVKQAEENAAAACVSLKTDDLNYMNNIFNEYRSAGK